MRVRVLVLGMKKEYGQALTQDGQLHLTFFFQRTPTDKQTSKVDSQILTLFKIGHSQENVCILPPKNRQVLCHLPCENYC
jgi:hypothetical protein